MIPNILKWGVVAAILSTALGGTPLPNKDFDAREQNPVAPPLPTEMQRGPGHLRQVALTFDAGADAEGLPELLGVLEQERVRATFFLTGRWACENLHLARWIAAQGHVLGNHTWAHKDLTKLEEWEVREELVRTDDRFVGWFGVRYMPLFRAPYGETNPEILTVAQKLGFHAIRWSIDTLDAMEPPKTAAFIEERILGKRDAELKGAIVLMHVGHPETVEALPRVIHGLRERGFEFVTVNEWIPGLSRPDTRQLGSTLQSQSTTSMVKPK